MAERIHTFKKSVTSKGGDRYTVHAEGELTQLGTWHGWLVFEPEAGDGTTLRTDRETTQPDRDDLEYWASGLEPVYLDGALTRASAAE